MPVDVYRILQHVKPGIIGEDIDLVTSLSKDALSVRADTGQLEQILLNFAVQFRPEPKCCMT